MNEHHDLVVVGEATNGREAVELTPLLRPAIVLMGVRPPPGHSGVEATKRISRLEHAPVVIGLSVHSNSGMESAMRQAGAGFLCKVDVACTI